MQVTVPDGLADEVAAQFLVNPVTVVGMVEVLQIPKGEWLIQDGAGSVLGRQMIQYAKLKGLKTINVVRRQEQVGFHNAFCSHPPPPPFLPSLENQTNALSSIPGDPSNTVPGG